MRLLDHESKLTPLGLGLAQETDEAVLKSFAGVFATSPCGSAWLAWEGVMMIDALDAKKAEQFLEQCTNLSPKTRWRRAATLRRWLTTLFPPKGKAPTPAPKEKVDNDAQLAFSNIGASSDPPPNSWPPSARFPHNEGGESVRNVLAPELVCSPAILIITGYASLDEILQLLNQRRLGANDRVRLMLGNDPYVVPRKTYPLGSQSLADEIRDYWLEQGFSVLHCGELLRVRTMVEQNPDNIQLRIATKKHPVHAKIYRTDSSITLGSSNYSKRGLEKQSEANARFERTEECRYQEASQLAEGIWKAGTDYRDDFLQLLEQLARPVSWREAVARACAALLEGGWMQKYLAVEHSDKFKNLWPHQSQGIAQALWMLENVGSVLIADATGSGKTLMGAWLLRAAYLKHLQSGRSFRGAPLTIVPPQVKEQWEADLQVRWKVDSHGPLSQRKAGRHSDLVEAVAETEFLALDEAHNYLGRSGRTRIMLSHYADHVILFTATPINRSPRDLLGIIELLGADNLSEESISVLRGLRKLGKLPDEELGRLKRETEKFMVRRTRSELNRIIAENREKYRLDGGRYAQYPEHKACYYDSGASLADCQLARRIDELSSKLTGVFLIGKKLKLPVALKNEGWTERQFLEARLKGVRAIARHLLMACLRSSRAAIFEHIHGTESANQHYTSDAPIERRLKKKPTGNTVEKLKKLAGHIPEWNFEQLERSAAPSWLVDSEKHRKTCECEADIFREIAELVRQLSDARETAKMQKLVELSQQGHLVLAFDAHLISLEYLALRLHSDGHKVELFTGLDGLEGKKRAEKLFGLGSRRRKLIGLCSDTLSEGMNLQKASRVVHLDTPTVIRAAEQRAGRIDRINTPHPLIEVWWPRDPPEFAPRRRDLLRERHSIASRLIGGNIKLPSDGTEESAQDEVLTPEEIVREVEEAQKEMPEFSDAFRPVRELIGTRGIISQEDYDKIKTSKAQIFNRISIVPAEQPWAFFVVSGSERSMPRWVLLESPTSRPVVDLATISDWLRNHLQNKPRDMKYDEYAEVAMKQFAQQLQQAEEYLLPARRQRALRQARRVMARYVEAASDEGAEARRRVAKQILKMLRPSGEEAGPDLRSMAEAWLRLIRPYQRRVLSERRRKDWPWTIQELEPLLDKEPIDTEQLKQAFEEIPSLQPVEKRIITMILAIPQPESARS